MYVIVFSDTVSVDNFSFTSMNDNGNYKTSTDISLSSDHLEFIQPELAIPARSFFNTVIEAFISTNYTSLYVHIQYY